MQSSIRFNRTQLFWYGLVTLFASFVIYKLILLWTWHHTTGKVVAFDLQLANGQIIRYNPLMYVQDKRSTGQAVIEFRREGKLTVFLAVENLDLELGDAVPVVYSPVNPDKAQVNSFFGFWFRPILILPIILWSAIVMGLTGRNSYWTFQLFPFRIFRTDILQGRFRK